VAVLERRTEEGGGLSTEEVTEPNFLHNLHSNYHSLVGLCPAYDDLELFDNGVEYAHPDVQMGSVFSDGTALTIHTDMRKTHASFARFSKKDADTWMRLWDEVGGYMDLMVRTLMYAPPIKLNDLTRALASWGVEERSEFLSARLRTISVADFLDKHFENDRIKAMLAFHAAICAYQPHIKGLAVTYPVLLGKITNWQLCKGGSHRLAHALMGDRQGRRTRVPAGPRRGDRGRERPRRRCADTGRFRPRAQARRFQRGRHPDLSEAHQAGPCVRRDRGRGCRKPRTRSSGSRPPRSAEPTCTYSRATSPP
jgi:hypothetical protein